MTDSIVMTVSLLLLGGIAGYLVGRAVTKYREFRSREIRDGLTETTHRFNVQYAVQEALAGRQSKVKELRDCFSVAEHRLGAQHAPQETITRRPLSVKEITLEMLQDPEIRSWDQLEGHSLNQAWH